MRWFVSQQSLVLEHFFWLLVGRVAQVVSELLELVVGLLLDARCVGMWNAVLSLCSNVRPLRIFGDCLLLFYRGRWGLGKTAWLMYFLAWWERVSQVWDTFLYCDTHATLQLLTQLIEYPPLHRFQLRILLQIVLILVQNPKLVNLLHHLWLNAKNLCDIFDWQFSESKTSCDTTENV